MTDTTVFWLALAVAFLAATNLVLVLETRARRRRDRERYRNYLPPGPSVNVLPLTDEQAEAMLQTSRILGNIPLTEKERKKLKQQWEAQHAGRRGHVPPMPSTEPIVPPPKPPDLPRTQAPR